MKKLFSVIAAVIFASAVFAQDQTKTEAKPDPKPVQAAQAKMPTHCYAMKDGAMVHCMGVKGEPMAKDVTLRNGTMVSTKGEVTTKDGKKTTLANGQCITMDGKITDFDKAHASMKKDSKSKM